jgi:SDR family mycofactocin-dependent oxidoreductase
VTRAALVTGAARGIGAATVRALARDGWRVVALDRCADDPRLPYPLATAAELEAVVADAHELAAGADAGTPASAGSPAGPADLAVALVGDTTDEAALTAAVALAAERWGGLDLVVANAGAIAGGVPAWELATERERALLDVNLGGVLAAARVAIPALLARPEPRTGRFVAVSSAAGSRGLPGLAAYCAAKAGVEGFIRALALDLRGSGVTANAVAPGSTRTPLLDESARLYGLSSAEDFAAQQPVERLLGPEEVAGLVAWLASDAGSGVTGATLPVDGGLAV